MWKLKKLRKLKKLKDDSFRSLGKDGCYHYLLSFTFPASAAS